MNIRISKAELLSLRSLYMGSNKANKTTIRQRKKQLISPDLSHKLLVLFRTQQPTPVFLPEESHRQRSQECYSPWGHKELDTTEMTSTAQPNTRRETF